MGRGYPSENRRGGLKRRGGTYHYGKMNHAPFKHPRRMTKAVAVRIANSRTGGLLGEERYIDRYLTGHGIVSPTNASGGEADPGTFLCLNSMIAGAGSSERIGRKIVCKSVYINGAVYSAPQVNLTSGDTPPAIMLALVLDKQSNGAQAQSEDVFKNVGVNAVQACNVIRNLEHSTRFTVLWSKRYIMPMQQMGGDSTNFDTSGAQFKFKIFKKLNLPVLFKDALGNVTSITDNSLHMMAFCDSTATTPILSYMSRVRFVG